MTSLNVDNIGVTDKGTKEGVMSILPNQQPIRALIRNNHYESFAQVDIVRFMRNSKYIFQSRLNLL